MSKEPNAPATTIDVSGLLAKLQELCGPPPVLSTESLEAYNQILAEFSKCIRAQDFVEQILAKDAADGTFEAARYQRHKTLLIERRFRDYLAVQAQRKKASAQKKEKAAKDV